MNWPTHLGILLLIVLAVAGIQFQWQASPQNPSSQASAPAAALPELQIESPVMHHYDENGQLAWKIEGATLQHYEAEDRTEITQPVAIIQARENKDSASPTKTEPRTEKDPWNLKAQTATLTQQHTQIVLNGEANVSNSDMTITSEQLLFDTTREFATTDKAVTIHARGSTAHADGLEADLANKILRLPAQVKETHEPTKRP